jgi:hypothetical protein
MTYVALKRGVRLSGSIQTTNKRPTITGEAGCESASPRSGGSHTISVPVPALSLR